MVKPIEAPHSAFQPMSSKRPLLYLTNLISRLPQSRRTKAVSWMQISPPRARAVSSLTYLSANRFPLCPVAIEIDGTSRSSLVGTTSGTGSGCLRSRNFEYDVPKSASIISNNP